VPERRGYIRPTRRKSEATQRAALQAAGCKVIYVEGKDENWKNYAEALRRGNEVVVDGFDRLADKREKAIGKLHDIVEKGAKLVDARSGLVCDPAAVALWEEACKQWLGEARSPTHADAVRKGRLGGRPPAEGSMPDMEAKEIWDNLDIGIDDALALIGLKKRTAYRRLGERGSPPGRPKTAVPKTPQPRTSKIYFCQTGGPEGPVKIGISVSLAGRLSSLKTGHHDDLKLLATINGGRKNEAALHRRFKEYHKRGEWFEFGPRLAKYIASLPKPKRS
jgi:hypothetical protein